MPGLGLHLGEAGMLEIRPGIGKFPGPFGGAMIIDHFFLRGGHGRIGPWIHEPLEGDGMDGCIHMVLRHFVDAEQRHRAPRERDCLRHSLLHHVAHLGCARLHIGAAEQRHPGRDGRLRGPHLYSLDVARDHDLLLSGTMRANG